VPSQPPPKPIWVAPAGELTVLDIDPLELARQITLIEFNFYKIICPKELVNQSWNKDGKEANSPNVIEMIHWFNDVSGWVTAEILSKDSPKTRSDIIKYFIKVAQHCKELKNYNAIFEFLAGLQAAAVNRLSKTWEKLDARTKLIHKELREVTSRLHNFKELRTIIKNALPPCIPYLGMFLTDLTFIDQGNPDKIQVDIVEGGQHSLINFVKLRRTAIVIKQIQLFQQTGYSLEPVSQIREYVLTRKQKSLSEEESFKISLNLEPRD